MTAAAKLHPEPFQTPDQLRELIERERAGRVPTHSELGVSGRAEAELVCEGLVIVGLGLLLEGRMPLGRDDHRVIIVGGVAVHAGLRS